MRRERAYDVTLADAQAPQYVRKSIGRTAKVVVREITPFPRAADPTERDPAPVRAAGVPGRSPHARC